MIIDGAIIVSFASMLGYGFASVIEQAKYVSQLHHQRNPAYGEFQLLEAKQANLLKELSLQSERKQ